MKKSLWRRKSQRGRGPFNLGFKRVFHWRIHREENEEPISEVKTQARVRQPVFQRPQDGSSAQRQRETRQDQSKEKEEFPHVLPSEAEVSLRRKEGKKLPERETLYP
ncbi:hypothetical protein HPG69_013898 [Diceros bicornis minor]|uniref:Uncharacterized protein n=1 Tax=Diceros bicornis minor TaxID=77932 RepID=A0A7J7ENE9_DICBM|nr:hypothetical protein HPG69_013898 [Diceros bicornis minor]